MKFEHILQVYWTKGFFFGGKLFYTTKLHFNDIFKLHLYGLNNKFKNLIIKRLEITTFALFYLNLFFFVNYLSVVFKKVVKTINILLSQVNNVNSTLKDQQKLNILRKYLLRTYQGYCHAVGKPVRGQRTWSNGWNSFKCNNVLRNFITKLQRINLMSSLNTTIKVDYRKVKKKYTSLPSKTTKTSIQTNLSTLKNKNTFLVQTNSWY